MAANMDLSMVLLDLICLHHVISIKGFLLFVVVIYLLVSLDILIRAIVL